MNTNEIVTRELVYRASSEEKMNSNPQKKKTLSLKAKCIIAFVAIITIISGIIFVKASEITVVGAGASETAKDSAAAGIIISSADIATETAFPEEITENKVSLIINKENYFANLTDINGEHVVAAEDSKNEITVGAGEMSVGEGSIIGSLGFVSGIFESYRADDPVLPGYLKEKFNPNFIMQLSAEEIELLCKLVEAEAPAEGIFGKILVANVVLNRVLSNRGFSNTVTGVIFEKFGSAIQFASAYNTRYWNSIVITDETREAVARTLAGEDYSDGALFFFAWRVHYDWTPTSGWTSLHTYLFKHGGHVFYK